MIAGLLLVTAIVVIFQWKGRDRLPDRTEHRSVGSVVQVVRAAELDVVLLSPDGSFRQGRNTFTIEFRRTGTTTLADVGAVRASANMPMPGMVMPGGLQVNPTGTPGLYAATSDFGMAGAWQFSIEWDGPAGKGSVNFQGGVQ